MNTRTFSFGTLFCFVALLALLPSGCSTESSQACSPGETQQCYCPGSSNGTQVCNSNGSRWGNCNCAGNSDTDTDIGTDLDADSDVDTDSEVYLSTATLVVGTWAGSWNCSGENGTIAWSQCPNGSLRGITTLGSTFENLATGTYTIEETDGIKKITVNLTETTVYPEEIRGDIYQSEMYLQYVDTYDALWVTNYCGFWMSRIEGGNYDETNNSDCESSVTNIGSGDDSCETDCDCGRCWYCESGVCRYGGEGPYGCYRGCE